MSRRRATGFYPVMSHEVAPELLARRRSSNGDAKQEAAQPEGPAQLLSKVSDVGAALGDMLAPFFFNDATADAATAGDVVGGALDGVGALGGFGAFGGELFTGGGGDMEAMVGAAHQLSDGDYLGGAEAVATGALAQVSALLPKLEPLVRAAGGGHVRKP